MSELKQWADVNLLKVPFELVRLFEELGRG